MVQQAMQDRTAEALRLWEKVYGDQTGLLHLTAVRTPRGSKEWDRSTIDDVNLTYPAHARAAAEWAIRCSDNGLNVYHCAHLLTTAKPPEGYKSGRVKQNAAALSSLYGECDGSALPENEYAPTCVVGEDMNKRMAAQIGADPSGYDLTQLLRVPNTVNYTHPDAPTVRLIGDNGERFVPAELDAMLPEGEPEAPEAEAYSYTTDENGHEPPVRLGEAYKRIWRGETPVLKDDGVTVDRSKMLRDIAYALAWGGAAEHTISAALRERDETLGYHKATRRRDGGRWYRNEASHAVAKVLQDQGAPPHAPEEDGHGSFSSSPHTHTQGSDGEDQQESTNGHAPLAGIKWFHKLGEPKPRKFVIGRVGPKGYPLVAFGAGGVAKSYIMLAGGIVIASASPGAERWLRWPIIEHGYVLYTDFELEVEEQHRRVCALCAGMGLPVPKRLAYLSGVGISTEETFRRANAFVKRHSAVATVVDSVGLTLPGDMERGKDVLAFFRRYIDPLRRLGTTPLLVDHEGKLQSGEKHKDKSPIGSAYKAWSARSVLQFEVEEYREKDSTLDLPVSQTKANFGPQEKPFGVSVAFEDGRVKLTTKDLSDAEMMDEDRVPVRERMLAALAIEASTVPMLAHVTGAAEGTIYNRLAAMIEAGEVVHDGYIGRKKLYRLAGSG
jgi:hypothetical protein